MQHPSLFYKKPRGSPSRASPKQAPRISQTAPLFSDMAEIQSEFQRISEHFSKIDDSLQKLISLIGRNPTSKNSTQFSSLKAFGESAVQFNKGLTSLILQIWSLYLGPSRDSTRVLNQSSFVETQRDILHQLEEKKNQSLLVCSKGSQRMVLPHVGSTEKRTISFLEASSKSQWTEKKDTSTASSNKTPPSSCNKDKKDKKEVTKMVKLLQYPRMMFDQGLISRQEKISLKKLIFEEKINKEELEGLDGEKIKSILLQKVVSVAEEDDNAGSPCFPFPEN